MRTYNPPLPFTAAMKLLIPTTEKVKGVTKKSFPNPDDAPLFFGSFRTYGGTEMQSNDVYTVYDTGTIDTYFNPDIKSDCRVYLCDTEEIFEIISRPEDINMRHQYMRFKVQKVGGKP